MKYINENRLMSLIENFFKTPGDVIHEIIQNSQRAGADTIEFSIDNNVLEARDNGNGCLNWHSIFVLAESGWSEEIQTNQQPAGFGMYHLFAVSEILYITSYFGSIEISTKQFFENKKYRENLYLLIDKTNTYKGFYLSAVLKEKSKLSIKNTLISDSKYKLAWYDIKIYINGEQIIRNTPNSFLGKDTIFIKTQFKENELYINIDPNNFHNFDTIHYLIDFYGQPISAGFYSNIIRVYYKIRKGLPIKPVLPYRAEIKNDSDFELFQKIVEDLIVEKCIEKINTDNTLSNNELITLMKIVEKIAIEKIELLDKFYYKKIQPYYTDSYWNDNYEEIIYKKNDILTFNSLNIDIIDLDGNSIDIDFDYLSLENGVYLEIENKTFPSWTKINFSNIDIVFKILEKKFDNEFTWYSCSSNYKNIKFISIVNNISSGSIFYVDSPDIVLNYEESILSKFYSESEDYQYLKEELLSLLETDIQNISNSYSKFDIFASLKRIKDIDISGLKKLEVKSDGRMYYEYCNTDGHIIENYINLK